MDLRSSSAQLCWYIIAFFTLLTGCQNPLAPGDSDYTQSPEGAYCGSAQAKSYSAPITTISGTANFQYRPLLLTNPSDSNNVGLYGAPISKGVTYAEVHILDSSGNIIQCGETDAVGSFSVSIPQVAGTYSVQVLSRSLSNKVKASVLKDIYSALPYSISKNFTVSASSTSVAIPTPLVASARVSEDSDLPGGAFNILADIFWANEFLRGNTSQTNFVADKVTVFWKQGFNPYSYFNAPSVLASFYVSSEDRLYILGGKNGDVKSSDTDHFDDSVILHEYGHFLEAHYGHSDTPGGSHNGNFIIDPRLAWSEGWANYFQAAVQNGVMYNDSYSGPKKGSGGFTGYVDTVGFGGDSAEGSGSPFGIQINRDLSEPNSTAKYDKSSTNEGIFREFSISRTLFKSMTNASGIPFAAIWDAFKELRNSHSPAYKFVNFGLYNSILDGILSGSYSSQAMTTWTTVLGEENQVKNTNLYGRYIASNASTSCSNFASITPVQDASLSYNRSNQLKSNGFYTYYHDGSSTQIVLKSTDTGSTITDLNLYVYSDGYYYSEEIQEAQANFSNSTLVRKSKTLNLSSVNETEVVDMSGLPAGYYMINVKASTYNKLSANFGGTANYYLYIGTSSTVGTCLVPN
jgi:hypothetical protein